MRLWGEPPDQRFKAPCPKPQEPVVVTRWQEALEFCDELLSLLDDLPESADDYVASVSQSVRDMSSWIRSHQRVTDLQWKALGNWQNGAEAWVRDDEIPF